MSKLKSLIDNKNTPHITYPINFFHCNNSDYPFINDSIYDLLDGDSAEQSSVLISEWANRGTLKDFMIKILTENYKDTSKTVARINIHNNEIIKNILFQVIYTLYCINQKYPNFRHNDLHLDNILVDDIPYEDETYFKYSILGRNFYVPNMGFRILLWDYDFANFNHSDKLNLKLYNSEFSDDTFFSQYFGILNTDNLVYDLYFFINSMFSDLNKNSILRNNKDKWDCIAKLNRYKLFVDDTLVETNIFGIHELTIEIGEEKDKKNIVQNFRLSHMFQKDKRLNFKNKFSPDIKFNPLDLLLSSDLFRDYKENIIKYTLGEHFFDLSPESLIEEYSI
jgi:hypothetical protein